MRIFERVESEVRGYIRSFPAVFEKARGAELFDDRGRRYIDFFAGAGTLNYGHNDPQVTRALLAYLEQDGIIHSLDKATVAKRAFLERFEAAVLAPRGLDYKVQFTGPTGTNAIEAALKLARMVKRRSGVVAFTNGYHGLTLGSLGLTGNRYYRHEQFGMRHNVAHMPYDGYFGPDQNTLVYLERYLCDHSSGLDHPAAVFLETVQGEGGVNVASCEWLRGLEQLCRRHDMLLVVDDIQVGNGRTGQFFSFERAGIKPDVIALSKSLGGGMPLSVLLVKPEYDRWKPGQHTGTFRGNNLAFVAATEVLRHWEDEQLAQAVQRKGERVQQALAGMLGGGVPGRVRGIGMIWGLELDDPGLAQRLSRAAFERGLLVETAGARDQVLKLLPPLITPEPLLEEGLAILGEALAAALSPNQPGSRARREALA